MEKLTTDFKHRLAATCLILGHILGWLFIIHRGDMYLLQDFKNSICWPNFENCQSFLEHLHPFVQLWVFSSLFVSFLLLLSVWNTHVSSKGRRIAVFVALLIHVLFLSMDFRMKMNQHLMHFTIDLAFVLLAQPAAAVRILVVAFYFWAGILKFHPDWTSGIALYGDPIWISKPWQPLAAKYVLVLETVFIWALYSKNFWLRLGVFVQLGLFHLLSWSIVGFYYPLLMYCLLLILLLYDRELAQMQPRFTKQCICLFFAFSLLQVYPRLISSEPAMTGQGRTFSLHMFDALIECEATLINEQNVTRSQLQASGTPRLRCDPVVFFMKLRNYCRDVAATEKVRGQLRSRRSSESKWHVIVDFSDACNEVVQDVSIFSNSWIRDPSR